jgi:hypothetical protein
MGRRSSKRVLGSVAGKSQPSTASIGRADVELQGNAKVNGPQGRMIICSFPGRGKACNCGGWDGDGSLGPIYCPSVISSCHADRATRGRRARAPTVHANSVPSSRGVVSQDGSREVRQDRRRFRVLALGAISRGGEDGAGVAGQVRPGVCLVKLGGIKIAAPRRLLLGTVSVTRMAEAARGWVRGP